MSSTVKAFGHFSYTALSFALIIGWFAVLRVFRTRSPRVIGSGPEEYRLIAVGTLRLFGLIAIASLLLHLEIARLYLAVAFPMGLTALIASRWIWRRVIARERARGEFRTAVLVVGVRGAVVDLARKPRARRCPWIPSCPESAYPATEETWAKLSQ